MESAEQHNRHVRRFLLSLLFLPSFSHPSLFPLLKTLGFLPRCWLWVFFLRLFALCSSFSHPSPPLFAVLSPAFHDFSSVVCPLLIVSPPPPPHPCARHNVEPSMLQNSCLKYTQRVAAFLESNEALLDSRHGRLGWNVPRLFPSFSHARCVVGLCCLLLVAVCCRWRCWICFAAGCGGTFLCRRSFDV